VVVCVSRSCLGWSIAPRCPCLTAKSYTDDHYPANERRAHRPNSALHIEFICSCGSLRPRCTPTSPDLRGRTGCSYTPTTFAIRHHQSTKMFHDFTPSHQFHGRVACCQALCPTFGCRQPHHFVAFQITSTILVCRQLRREDKALHQIHFIKKV
jgi:hypothetical protein